MHLRVSLFTLWHRTLSVFPGFSAHHPLNMSVPRALSQAPSLLAPHSLLVDHPMPHSLRNMPMGLRPLSSPGPLRSLHPQGLLPTRYALVPSSQQIQDCSPGGRTAPPPVLPISGGVPLSSRNQANLATLHLPIHPVPGECLFGLLLLSISSGTAVVHSLHHLSPGLHTCRSPASPSLKAASHLSKMHPCQRHPIPALPKPLHGFLLPLGKI